MKQKKPFGFMQSVIHRISSKGPSLGTYLRQVLRHHYLLRVLSIRDLKIKYAQSFLGIGWSVLQPLGFAVIYTLFFTYIVSIPDAWNIPYPLYVFAGVLLWNLFYYIAMQSSSALLHAHELVNKMGFPRLLLPIAKVYVAWVDFGWSFGLLLIYAFIQGEGLHIRLLLSLGAILLISVQGLGFGLWASALSMRRRDTQHLLPFLLGIGLWLTPVFYATQTLPEWTRELLSKNPLYHSLALFRYALFTQYPPPHPTGLLLSCMVTALGISGGIYYFKKMETRWVDAL